MIALDTNILARYLLKDDAAQFERARILIEGAERITAPVTVLLELAWALEVSDCSRQDVARALRLLAGLPNFTIRPSMACSTPCAGTRKAWTSPMPCTLP